MGSKTPRLDLYTIDTTNDGLHTFNIDVMLNDNWKKIDEKTATLDPVTKKVPVSQLPEGTTSAKGAVQLNSATNSTSTTQAATPSAVKTAYDKANTAQTDITNHKNNTVSHVIQTDKDNWNAKETPSGAQAKADAAKQAGIDWAKGYGLGTNAKNIVNGTDLNTLTETGFYYGGSLTNAPSTHSYYICHTNAGTSTAAQHAIRSDNAVIYTRVKSSGTWSAWQQLETTAGAQAKADSAQTTVQTNLNSHTSNTNNPHNVTKSQVGLGSVDNYGTAIQTEAEAGTADNKFMTPLKTKQAITALQAVKSVAGKIGTVSLVKGDVGLGNVDNVQQASKTEFNTHTADTTSHITAAERTAWNAAESNAKAWAKANNMVFIKDTRDVNGTPASYVPTSEDRGLYVEFKSQATIGLGSIGYCTVLTDSRWLGSSGGNKTQIALTDDKMMVRTSTSETTWGAWRQIALTDSNVASASKLQTARTISLTGDVSGSTTFDGSGNVSITATVADDSHNHVISNIDGLQTALDSKETPSGAQAKVDAHAGDTTAHITATERSTWNAKASTAVATTSANGLMLSTDKSKLDGIAAGAQPNQNAFSNVKVGATTVSADSATDILELVAGTNITLTPDATNDKVTIATVSGLETTAGAQAKADAARDMAISTAAIDATNKANTAETSAKNYTYSKTESDNRFAKRAGFNTTINAAGWYRIATNGPVVAGGTGGDRAHAMFTVRDIQSSQHSAVTFYASYHFGERPTLVVLSNSSFSGANGLIDKIRIVEGATYEGAAVEIYVGGTGSVQFSMYDNEHSSGWTPQNWLTGSVPTGFTATEIDLATHDPAFAIASNGNNNAFMVKRDGKAYTVLSELETTAGAQAKVEAHAENTTVHITATERNTWNAKASTAVATTIANGLMSSTDKSKLDGIAAGAQPNQNAFSNVKVGATTVSADSATDTLELVAGTNITLTPDVTNDKVTIATVSGLETTAGAQAKVDAHAGDTTAHITATERSTWNAKASTAVATTSANGLMSSSDKSKLDGIANNANNYSHPTGDGNNHVPANGTTNNGKFLQATGTAGITQWAPLPTASTDGAGIVQLSSAINSTLTTQAATPSAVKSAYDLAATKTTASEAMLAAEHESYKTVKSGKDSNGIYTIVEHRRKKDNTLVRKSVLSGGTSPLYTTRTITFYASNGITVSKADVFTLTYDADGDLISEV